MDIIHHYNNDHNTISAIEVVPYILEILPVKPKSVLDVGCGLAQWLKVFKDNGIETVLGIDGEHVPSEKIMVDPISEFKVFDLRSIKSLNLKKQFDLALSLEVAEHLPKENAEDFIGFLTQSSNIIIFAAAVIGQTGENHINEQNPNYWQRLFRLNGFVMLDAFREYFWNYAKVNWWYRQNMFLVVKEEVRKQFRFKEYENFYIHPELFAYKENILNNKQQKDFSFISWLKGSIKKKQGKYND